MKRIIIVTAMLIGMVFVSAYSLYHVTQVKNEMNGYIAIALQASREGDREKLMRDLDNLSNYWKKEERKLIHYVRHSHIDEITRGMAKLPSLAEFENYAELSAELFSIQWQMETIWQSELPIWENVL